jgi:hypothetical protein
VAAQIQNIGVNLFAGTTVFDGPEDFPAMINRELWNTITRVLNYVDTVQEFISDISINIDDIQIDFINCDRELEERVVEVIAAEVAQAEACFGLGEKNFNFKISDVINSSFPLHFRAYRS